MSLDPSVTDSRITYLFALGDNENRKTIFQMFDERLIGLHWAFEAMTTLPATLYELNAPKASVIASRVCGIAGWRHHPLPYQAICAFPFSAKHPFVVVMSNDRIAALAIADHFRGRSIAPFHISSEAVEGAVSAEEATVERLRAHCMAIINQNPSLDLGGIRAVIDSWRPWPRQESGIAFKGNYRLLPNQMTLMSLGNQPEKHESDWSSEKPQDYVAAIMETANAVDRLRSQGKIDDSIRLIPPRPDTWLVEPSLLPDFKRNIDMDSVPMGERSAVRDVIRRFERQRSHGTAIGEEKLKRIEASAFAEGMRQTRNAETRLFAAAVGAATAGTVASVYRLTPAPSQISGAVRHFADNIRAEANTSPDKVARLFDAVQARLSETLPAAVAEKVETSTWGIKALTDDPIEWLPVAGLPLCVHRDISRIPATPGDLTVSLLARHEPIRIPVKDFSNILVISAFEEGERFDRMRAAFDAVSADSAGVTLTFVRVGTEDQMIAALDAYDGPMLIFDGHGAHPANGEGRLLLGKEEVNIWTLSGRVRVPPIVMLSACDTHASDRNWATTSNAFLRLGARTVLATLLPVGVDEAAVFAGRLIYRLAAFLPVACRILGRVIRWSEVVGGMLRMQLVTDILRPLLVEGKVSAADYATIHLEANIRAHVSGRAALDYLEDELVRLGIYDTATFKRAARLAIATSDTIRYAQMGNPETIIIGSVGDLPLDLQIKFEPMREAMTPHWRDAPGTTPEHSDKAINVVRSLLKTGQASQSPTPIVFGNPRR